MINKNKGITLIALVVTIIVLLILAGVSIVTLAGDNGIITRTKQSKQLSEEAAAREKVKLAVQAARIHDKSYSYLKASEVRTAVNNEEGLSTDKDGDFPVIVTAGKFTFSVSSTGEVGYIEGISIPSELTVGVGLQGQTITPSLGQGITGTIIWKSSDKNKVKVNNGTLTVEAVTGNNPVKITASIKDLATGIEYNGECLVTAKNVYTVTYYGYDKTTPLQDPITVLEGTSATYSGATPTKAADENYTYTFNKWLNISDNSDADEALGTVNSNLSVYASFKQHSNIPTVDISKMGDSVKYGEDTTNWEVFFEDDDNIYLIYKTSVSDPITGVTGYGSMSWNAIRDTSNPNTFDNGTHKVYPNSTDVHYSSYLNNTTRFPAAQKWMSKYLAYLNTNSTYSDYDNMLGTLFMLDTDVWQYGTLTGDHTSKTSYYNSSLAKYVIGSPTLEMITITRNSDDSRRTNYTCNVTSATGYTSDATTSGDIPNNTTWNHSSQYYWLASPYSGSSNYAWRVYGNYAYLSSNLFNSTDGFRPVVCLNSSVKLVENTSNEPKWIAQIKKTEI